MHELVKFQYRQYSLDERKILNEIYQKLGIEKYIEIFEKLETIIQKDIVDEKIKLIGYNNLVFELEKGETNSSVISKIENLNLNEVKYLKNIFVSNQIYKSMNNSNTSSITSC